MSRISMVPFYRKLGIEVAWLVEHFGVAYLEYQRQVKALVPFLV